VGEVKRDGPTLGWRRWCCVTTADNEVRLGQQRRERAPTGRPFAVCTVVVVVVARRMVGQHTEEEADAFLLRGASLLLTRQSAEQQRFGLEGGDRPSPSTGSRSRPSQQPLVGASPATIQWTRQVGTVRDGCLVQKTYDHVRGKWSARIRQKEGLPPASRYARWQEGNTSFNFDDEEEEEEKRDAEGRSTNDDDLGREIARLQQKLRRLRSEHGRSQKAAQGDGGDAAFDYDAESGGDVDAELGAAKPDSDELRSLLLPATGALERQPNLVRPGAIWVFPDGAAGEVRDNEEEEGTDEPPPPPPPPLRAQSSRRSDAILLEASLFEDDSDEANGAPELVYEAKIVRRKHEVLVVAGIVLVVSATVALAVGIPMRMAQQSAAAAAAAATSSTRVLNLDLVPLASLTVRLELSEKLTGPIPSVIGRAKRLLTLVALNDNDLSGPIPTEIGLLTSLSSMSLNGNRLTGTLPSQLGDLKSSQV
jgi:hypothetical protein